MLFILWLISVPGITPHKLLNKPAHFWISVAMNCEYRNPSKISAFLTFIAWLCPKAIKTYWPKIGIFPMHHHRIHCHFLIVFKTLASRSLSPSPSLSETWCWVPQDLAASLPVPSPVKLHAAVGFPNQTWYASYERNLWAIQLFHAIWFTNDSALRLEYTWELPI